jgi:hypothetical protein
MAIQTFDSVGFGGVDSRSNPASFPYTRSVRCRNWVPTPGGVLELRHGYKKVTTGVVNATPAHSAVDYRLWDESFKGVLVGKGANVYKVNLATGAESSLYTGLASSAQWSTFRSNNWIHVFNGTDQGFYDGSKWRNKVGVRALTSFDTRYIGVGTGVRAPNSTEVSGSTVSVVGSGGLMAVTAFGGMQAYMQYFDTSVDELGPAAAIGTRQAIASGATNKLSFSGLPNMSAVSATVLKLITLTTDGGVQASPVGKTNAVTVVSTGQRVGHLVAINRNMVGVLNAGDLVQIRNAWDPLLNGIHTVTNVNGANFQFSVAAYAGASDSTSTKAITFDGPLLFASNTATTLDITALVLANGAGCVISNAALGFPKSVVNGANPGYQFYAALYNPVTGDVGNALPVGTRIANTETINFRIYNFFDPSVTDDPEWVFVFGRTVDGGEVPYIMVDASGNWATSVPGQITLTLSSQTGVAFDFEMPNRNAPPQNFDKVVFAGDKAFGALPSSPDIYWTDTPAIRAGSFVGNPTHCWPQDNKDTFPTYEPIVALKEDNSDVWAFSRSHFAIFADNAGLLGWQEVYPIGIAGPRAFCKTHYGSYWLTAERQLATMTVNGPEYASTEYENGLLAKFGKQYLSSVELSYIRDQENGIDQIKIRGLDVNGVQYVVVHDFRLRDSISLLGSGRDSTYMGVLAAPFTMFTARDTNGVEANYANGADGHLYQLDQGDNDAGAEFTADYITLVKVGADRAAMQFLDWLGDEEVELSVSRFLAANLDGFEVVKEMVTPNPKAGREDDFWQTGELEKVDAEGGYLLIRFRLTSHSADGTLALNDPPHIPLESYGRIYIARPGTSDPRGWS